MNLATVKAKECQACGKLFGCPEGVRRHVWMGRKYCSQPCSSKGRVMESDKWRAKATKVCTVCEQVFRPNPGMMRRDWDKKDVCDTFCRTAAGHGRRVVVADPLDQVEPHQRLKWLRLSASKCGKKTPWTIEWMAKGCGLSGFALWKAESGGRMAENWIPKAAARLAVDPKLFTVPVERFAKVVNEAGLTAKLSVPKEERRAA
jgi:hypothetical protein